MGSLSISVDGLSVTKVLLALKKKINSEIEKEMLNTLEIIEQQSRAKTPVVTGTLRDSHSVEIRTAVNKIRGFVIVGGSADTANPSNGRLASDYALEVHESTKPPRSGERKFLSKSTLANTDVFKDNMIKAVRRIL